MFDAVLIHTTGQVVNERRKTSMQTVPLTTKHAHQVAALHIQGINRGFISSLGMNFVTSLYEAIAQSSCSFGFAVEERGRLLGYVAFTNNLNKLYKSVVVRKGWRFALLLAGKLFSFSKLKRVLETLLYPARIKKKSTPAAELLSIVIGSESRGTGLATQLVRRSFEHCRALGLDKVRVLVAAENAPANKLYQKCGFTLAGQIENHGVASNIYEASTAEPAAGTIVEEVALRLHPPVKKESYSPKRQLNRVA